MVILLEVVININLLIAKLCFSINVAISLYITSPSNETVNKIIVHIEFKSIEIEILKQ